MNVSFDVDAIALLKAYIVKDDGAETCGNQILLKTSEPSFTAKASTTSSNFSKRRRCHRRRRFRKKNPKNSISDLVVDEFSLSFDYFLFTTSLTFLPILLCLRSLSSDTSRMAVQGAPSSCSNRISFKATKLSVRRDFPLNTVAYVP